MTYVVKSVLSNQYKISVDNQNGSLLPSPVALHIVVKPTNRPNNESRIRMSPINNAPTPIKIKNVSTVKLNLFY